MQASDDPDLAAAVDAPERTPQVRLRADWDRDQSFDHPMTDLSTVVDEVSIERSLTGDLPAETTLVEGYTTAKLTAQLSGQRPDDPRDIARMLSPIRADSPLFGKPSVDVPIQCDLGLTTPSGERLVRQFTGSVRRLDVTSATRAAELEALDPADKLRAAVTLPLYGDRVSAQSSTANTFHAYTNTQWLIDFVLRRNGIYFSPPPRPGVIWAMTGHGSLAADIGHNALLADQNFATSGAPLFVDGRYGLAANGTPDVYAEVTYNSKSNGFNIVVPYLLEFHVKAGQSNVFHARANGTLLTARSRFATGDGHSVEVAITSTGQLLARVYSGTTVVATLNGPRITGPTAWHSVGLWLFADDTTRVITHRWQLDGAVTPSQTVPFSALSFNWNVRAEIKVSTSLPLQCMQITQRSGGPPPDWGTPHEPQCDLDVGLNWILTLPSVQNADSWDVIKQVAAAEYGLVGFNEFGRFFFRTRSSARTATDAANGRALTAAVSLSNLHVSTSVDSIRNQITATTQRRLETDTPVTVFQNTDPNPAAISAGALSGFRVTLSRPVKVPQVLLASVPIANWSDTTPVSGFCAVNASTGAYVPSGVVVMIETDDKEGEFFVRIRNNNSFPVRLIAGARPALRVAGVDLVEHPPTQRLWTNPSSIAKWGSRVLALPDNPHRQETTAMDTIAQLLLADLADPVPVLDNVPVTGDPRTQLGDVVTLHDPDGLGGPVQGSVIGIRRTLNNTGGLTDTLTIRSRRSSS